MIAFVFDLSRRLAQLNERDSDPVANGKGVVLIDEIDLHLHPAWQRQITINLPRVFPGLQFIVTTHSPQVIGETEAGRVVVLREGGRIERQDESLGRDSGWILRHIMETTERNADLQAGLDAVDQLIDADKFTEARRQVDELRQRFGNEKELIGAAAEIERWEILGNEAHQ
jgi:predicted ATP-binding protein involved in virulence